MPKLRLAHIHDARVGLVHRDVKPENLRFRAAPRDQGDPESAARLVLLDFGLCCAAAEEPKAICGRLSF